jgi:hypothetical protein
MANALAPVRNPARNLWTICAFAGECPETLDIGFFERRPLDSTESFYFALNCEANVITYCINNVFYTAKRGHKPLDARPAAELTYPPLHKM